MRAWIADIVSRLRRLFVRGRSQRVQDRGRRQRPSAGEAPREIEVALDQQTPDTAGGSADNSAVPHQAIKDPQSGATEREVHRGLKTDRTPEKECAPSGASNAEATAPISSLAMPHRHRWSNYTFELAGEAKNDPQEHWAAFT